LKKIETPQVSDEEVFAQIARVVRELLEATPSAAWAGKPKLSFEVCC
jgi:hypothetical protein